MATKYQGYLDLGNGTGFVYITDNAGNFPPTDPNALTGGGAGGIGIPNTAKDPFFVKIGDFALPKINDGTRLIRIWIDADYGGGTATATTKSVNAVEITEFIFPRHLNSPIPIVNVTVASNKLTFDREAAIMMIRVDGGGASPANDIKEIVCPGAQNGDKLILVGDPLAGNAGVLKNIVGGTDNITTKYAGTSYTLDTSADVLELIYDDRSGTAGWREETRNQVGAPEMRGIGQALPLTAGMDSMTILAAGTTKTIYPGGTGTVPTNSTHKNSVTLAGTVTLLGNQNVTVDTTDAIVGDRGTIYGGTSRITLGGNQMFIGPQELSAELALSGQWKATWEWDGVNVNYTIIPTWDVANTGFVDTAQIKASAVTDAKIATGIDGAKLAASTVTNTQLDASSNQFVLTTLLSFKSGERNKQTFGPFGFEWKVIQARYAVFADIGITDDATINIETNTAALYLVGMNYTFTAGDVAGTTSSTLVYADAYTYGVGDFMSVVPTKTTDNGGLVAVTIVCEKI